MFTVGTLFCGYACIVLAMQEDYRSAAVFIGVATLLDVLDGRIARLAGAASKFGGEFDSLADVISFGVAPAVLVFAWGLEPLDALARHLFLGVESENRGHTLTRTPSVHTVEVDEEDRLAWA